MKSSTMRDIRAGVLCALGRRAGGVCAAALLAAGAACKQERPGAPQPEPPGNVAVAQPAPVKVETIEALQAVVVTVELDFGGQVPSIAEALRHIERRHEPDDGVGRAFAILDAWGEPTRDGKLLISMHISTEKPGVGTLVFRPTGKILWQSLITPATKPPTSAYAGKKLFIMLADENGKPHLLDGSNNPRSILDTIVRDYGLATRDFWPDGDERELTVFYSACGCPVKVMARREGERTVRTRDVPVIFPDDPAVAATIHQLAGW
jgi:hypothetical protein